MYNYYSLKQLESDLMDTWANLHKVAVPGIEIRCVSFELNESQFYKFQDELNEKAAVHYTIATSDLPEPDRRLKALVFMFSGLEVRVSKEVPLQLEVEDKPYIPPHPLIIRD